MSNSQECEYDKRNTFVIICDTGIQYRLTTSVWRQSNFQRDDFSLSSLSTRNPRFSSFHVSSNPLSSK